MQVDLSWDCWIFGGGRRERRGSCYRSRGRGALTSRDIDLGELAYAAMISPVTTTGSYLKKARIQLFRIQQL